MNKAICLHLKHWGLMPMPSNRACAINSLAGGYHTLKNEINSWGLGLGCWIYTSQFRFATIITTDNANVLHKDGQIIG